MPDVVVVGDLATDVVVLLDGAPAPGSDRPAAIRSHGGGAGANVAVHLARLGTPVTFAGCVGDDAAGTGLVAELAAAGVTSAVRTVAGAASGTIVSLVEPGGQRSMLADRGANLALAPDDVPTPRRHLHLSGYTLLNPGSRAAALFALRLAGSVGASVSVDAASAGPILALGAQRFLDWLEPGVLLLANSDELAALTGAVDQDRDNRDQEVGLAALVVRGLTVVLKRGSEGSMLASRTLLGYAAAEPATVRDTTGAGDAFAAGFLAALWGGAEWTAALRAGNRLGAAAVGQLGARPPR